MSQYKHFATHAGTAEKHVAARERYIAYSTASALNRISPVNLSASTPPLSISCFTNQTSSAPSLLGRRDGALSSFVSPILHRQHCAIPYRMSLQVKYEELGILRWIYSSRFVKHQRKRCASACQSALNEQISNHVSL